MGISDIIATFINNLITESDGIAELQRAELAAKFGCVPSQINYVISTRFSPEHGYIVESRRGGGGFIRISRVAMDPQRLVMHTVNVIGSQIDSRSATALIANLCQAGAIDENTARLILSAISPAALRPANPDERTALRASIMKQILVTVI